LKDSVIQISGLNELHLKIDLKKSSSDHFGVIFSNSKDEILELGFNIQQRQFYIDRTRSGKTSFSEAFPGRHIAPRILNDSILEISLFLDYASLELFADGGTVAMTEIFFPNTPVNQMRFFQHNGNTSVISAELFDLTPAGN